MRSARVVIIGGFIPPIGVPDAHGPQALTAHGPAKLARVALDANQRGHLDGGQVAARTGIDFAHRTVDGLLHSVSPCAVKPPLPEPGGGGLPCLSGLDWRYHSDSGVEVPVVARAVAVCEPVVEL